MERKSFICPLDEVKMGDANSKTGEFSGYASVFGSVDLGGDQIHKGAYTKTLNKWGEKGMMPQMLYYHDSADIIGEWTKMEEDEKGLYVEGRLWVKGDESLESAKRAYNILKSNSVKGLSIGYGVPEGGAEVQELTTGGRIRVLKEIELFEVSIAPWAMEPKASVTDVKSFVGDDGQVVSKREVEKLLRDVGLSQNQAKAFLAEGYKGISREESELEELNASLDRLLSINKE